MVRYIGPGGALIDPASGGCTPAAVLTAMPAPKCRKDVIFCILGHAFSLGERPVWFWAVEPEKLQGMWGFALS